MENKPSSEKNQEKEGEIDLEKDKELSSCISIDNITLIGHKSSVNEIQFHGKYFQILLSCGNDNTIRIWNAQSRQQLVLFGGTHTHLSGVFSIDWHPSYRYFVSGSVDNTVKIFYISDKIIEIMNKSFRFEQIKTIIKDKALFSRGDLHPTMIDCVRYNGNFILSKSFFNKLSILCISSSNIAITG